MPRIPRNHYPEGYYHVMNRGVARESIFSSESDKNFYRNLSRKVFRDYSLDILAYCIMGNHFHFVIKGDLMAFSKALHKVNLSYAMAYNKRRDRVGHVFQNRFKSELIDSREYLLAALRYVHNNPVKGKIVRDAREYPWSSYREYLEASEKRNFYITREEQRLEILDYFDGSPKVFEKFHQGRDYHMFLDTSENVKERQAEIAMNLIENNFPGVDQENLGEISSNVFLIYKIVSLLLEKTNLSYQEIAELVNTSKSQVGKISRFNDENPEKRKYLH